MFHGVPRVHGVARCSAAPLKTPLVQWYLVQVMRHAEFARGRALVDLFEQDADHLSSLAPARSNTITSCTLGYHPRSLSHYTSDLACAI